MTSSTIGFRMLRGGRTTPLWLQLKHALRDLVAFDLRPGDRIPSEAEIGAHYGLSRITVRQAITALVEEGLLHRQHGRGTFVRFARQDVPLSDPAHFLATGFDMADPADIVVHEAGRTACPYWLAARLGVSEGAQLHKVRKILVQQGRPSAFRTSFVPAALAPDLLEADLRPPLYLVLQNVFGLAAHDAEERIEVIAADEFRAGLLGVGLREPLVLMERVAFLESGEAIECARTFYRADEFRFSRRLRG
ncbi:GntR family transcriptional regulator [Falsiroseomonas oryzae]|uniref:GntR family transcriptional regulator n=1 Tax=Falsiroseomonas oryzae TaxID=2766473 RepID=UPI0022EAE030|nr:GntR family transcriptional regulator [Roseomonas sp. MO-31]